MRCNEDRNLSKTFTFKSAPQQLIPYRTGHASEIQIVKNQYVRNGGFTCCVLSHVPSRWPKSPCDRLLPSVRGWYTVVP
jgi:hypothetical protein